MSPTLCLNMIVKNESKIIQRLFDSVLPIIDSYCICDTGSTDNTVELIETYFREKGIPGKVVKEPFKNFCHNRNFAIQSCIGLSDFIILLDADMVLEIGPSFQKAMLGAFDSFNLLQGNPDFYYYNARIVRNNGNYAYKGVTHEYLNCPHGNRSFDMPKDALFISDIGDGGCKSDKFERDIRLLTEGLKEEPNNERYHFYLANSYHDLGHLDKAIEHYQKRIDLGGWDQEVWFSYYKMGFCYKRKGNMAEAISCWMNGYQYYPNRIENLFEIVHHYRCQSKPKLANMFYQVALKSLHEKHEIDRYLFLHKDIYTHRLFIEYTIFSHYIGNRNINSEVVAILNASRDTNQIRNLLSNLKFYKFIPTMKQKIIFDKSDIISIQGELRRFLSSSSCMISYQQKDCYLMNVRYVNYSITPQGSYINCDDHIITYNKQLLLDSEFHILREEYLEEPFVNRRYIGVEDLKIYRDANSNQIHYIGTGYHANDHIGIVCGDYPVQTTTTTTTSLLHPVEIKSAFNDEYCEKNWVFTPYEGKTRIIYKWYPLQICEIRKNKLLHSLKTKEMPRFFSHIRGSSCGFPFGTNEIWFVGHIVSYEHPRNYYHVVSVFDKDLNLLRYTAPFKFEGECIEYCLSIHVQEDKIVMNYSTWDRTTRLAVYEKTYFESLLCYFK